MAKLPKGADIKKLAQEALQNKIESTVQIALNKAIISLNTKPRKENTVYSPSSMYCKRMMFYKRIGEKKDPTIIDPVMIGIQEIGTDRHDRLQKYFESMKDLNLNIEYMDIEKFIKLKEIKGLEVKEKVGMETKLYHPDLTLSFMTDGILRIDDEYFVLEIKTEISHKFNSRKGVDPKHYNQATAYATVFGLDKVIFLYECRDIPEKKIYILEVTEDMKRKFIALIQEVDEDVANMEIPFKVEDTKSCTYCQYKRECEKDGD